MAASRQIFKPGIRSAATTRTPQPVLTKEAGDISSIFPSLKPDYQPIPLPVRFKELKLSFFRKNEEALKRSWERLVRTLEDEVETIGKRGSSIIPSLEYKDIISGNVSNETKAEIRYRGSAVIRHVVPRSTALEWKVKVRNYIARNGERVKAFPPDSPAVYELYWTPSQVEARAHPNVLATQKFLQRLWHSSDPGTQLSHSYPLSYADRLRIRQPGDARFTLGPHIDSGSLERWEDPEYSRVYRKILEGNWEEYDPFDAKHRVKARMDLYNGAGACSMMRLFQGWLSMSDTAPGEGTLRVCPMLKQSTAYTILRPFFDAESSLPVLDATFPGSVPGACQEYTSVTHPHLALSTTMVSMPRVEPGDYVAWHCDSLHSVEEEHRGTGDSSVLYIPTAPLCQMNVEYLMKQRQAALTYSPPWDFPGAGGPGEMGFQDAVDWSYLNPDGLQAMGMGTRPWKFTDDMSEGEKQAIVWGNSHCFTAE